jgi:hypothetical protein
MRDVAERNVMEGTERTHASVTVSSFKPEVLVEGKWSANGLVFATRAEAESYAHDLYSRWTTTSDHRAVESDQPVNYERLANGTIKPVLSESA